MKDLTVLTAKNGTVIVRGKMNLLIVQDWITVDEETGFFSEECIETAKITIAHQLIESKFKHTKINTQNVMAFGSAFIIMQPLIKGKVVTRQQAAEMAKDILNQWFHEGVEQGYFDNVDPSKLAANVDESELSKEE